MNTIKATKTFNDWVKKVKDPQAKAEIATRIDRARLGNFGDVKPAGEGVSEMRIDIGKGYRIYYTKVESVVYLLLCGGNKKTQHADIAKAKKMKKELK